MKRLKNLISLATRPRPKVGATPSDVVHRENKTRLLRYRPRLEGLAYRTPVVLVPSLINRHYVLDLMPGKSFAEYLVEQGHDVYCIDWGTPGPEDRYVTFDDVCDTYLGRAIHTACRQAGTEQAHVLGYCMGGTLTAIHAGARPERFASMVALAAPIRFDDGGLLSRWTQTETFDVDALVSGFGNVPWQLMQSAFHMLRPTLNLAKTAHLIDRAWDDEFLDGFLAIETWSNDNVSLPGEFYRTYIEDLYRGNKLVSGELRLSGRPVDLARIDFPLLVVSFQHDHIVPSESAGCLRELVSSRDVQHLDLAGGHVGAVVSRAARQRLWPILSQFWAERDGTKRRDGEKQRAAPKPPRARRPARPTKKAKPEAATLSAS